MERTIVCPDIEVPRHQVLRLLGMGGKRKRQPRQSILDALAEEMTAVGEILDPVAVMQLCPAGLEGSQRRDLEGAVVVGICTVGEAVEQRMTELTAAGDMARAMIVDAIGSAAVEELANHCNQRVCNFALERVLNAAPRRSPGYGGWQLAEQELIFELLRPDEIGISLTERWMMTPRKSVSFAVPLHEGRGKSRVRGGCARCGLRSCLYREQVESTESSA